MEIIKILKASAAKAENFPRECALCYVVLFFFLIIWQHTFSGAPAGGKGEASPPPETEKILVGKWCYFSELYKKTKVLEDLREMGKKSIFH